MTGKHFAPLLRRANAFAFVAGNDTENSRHASAISRHHAPELCTNLSPFEEKARVATFEEKAQGMPDARCTRSLVCKM
jgi:hypothetical protein